MNMGNAKTNVSAISAKINLNENEISILKTVIIQIIK